MPFRVRLNCIDHYQAKPTLYDPQLEASRVPVIRVFGATENGQKVCAHIHGAFPYLYIEYDGGLEKETVGTYRYRLHLSIDQALAASYRNKSKFVARVTLVKGVPFYGYHVGYRFFLKIYLFSPSTTSRLAHLLRQGAVLSSRFQPYEAHLSYVLQFMTDYNLYGCDYLESQRVKFRAPVPEEVDAPEESITRDLPRASHCSIEVDICAHDIANRKVIKERRLHHDFVERVRPLPPDLKLVPSIAALWEDEACKQHEASPFPLVSLSPDPRSAPQRWMSEDAFRECLRDMIADEDKKTFETFVAKDPLERSVKTALQSVEDLHPANLGILDADPDLDMTDLVTSQNMTSHMTSQNMTSQNMTSQTSQNMTSQTSQDIDPNAPLQTSKRAFHDALMPPGKRSRTGDLPRPRLGLLQYPVDESEIPPSNQEAAMRTQYSPLRQGWNPADEPGLFLTQPSPPSSQDVEMGLACGSAGSAGSAGGSTSLSQPVLASGSASLSQPVLGGSLPQTQESDLSKLPLGFGRAFVFAMPPPSVDEVCTTFQALGLPDEVHQDPYYSNDKDVPARPREYAGRRRRLYGNTIPYLPDFDPRGPPAASKGQAFKTWREGEAEVHKRQTQCSFRSWEFAQPPPSYSDVDEWWKARCAETKGPQIDGKQTTRPGVHMSVMSVEVHANTRGKLCPDPEQDEVQCVFWTLNDPSLVSGVVVLARDDGLALRIRRLAPGPVAAETSELGLLARVAQTVRDHDPDVLTGYEVHSSSWGYLVERARFKYGLDLCDELSRIKGQHQRAFPRHVTFPRHERFTSMHVTGRHMINIWRAMRAELDLQHYTMENVAWHLLHRRIPHYPWQALTRWYQSGLPLDLHRLVRYYSSRARIDIEMLDASELVARTSEQARLLGVDFSSVYARGSQFKVESMMFRLAKPENFLLVSPDRTQVAAQNAVECQPLVIEPESAFYVDPVVVLDFQSLYPSIMIAYNYCYSTYLGRVAPDCGGSGSGGSGGVSGGVSGGGVSGSRIGFGGYRREAGLLGLLDADGVTVAPNGAIYAGPRTRRSLLAKMLAEILETRVMVKAAMKHNKDDRALQRLLNNRQLALKLLANVTYGYTSASFSGRMPCPEIADSIVQTGRETLERAVHLIHSVQRWNAEVVYGDTDSLFVMLRGRTRQQAFDIGQEMARAVTDANPRPVKLRFEKVYHPCVLLAKKRYAGLKYESAHQPPEFEAKGIETVRRDGTPAQQKMEAHALALLFASPDLSAIKSYVQQQCHNIMRGTVSVQDFCFAREVRLGTYSGRGPPGAVVSTRRMLEDARAEPQYGERVPYVVVAGGPNARLVDRCVSPRDLVESPHRYRLDARYYLLQHMLPPLDRILGLVGASARAWYDEMPKVQPVRTRAADASAPRPVVDGMRTLESYFLVPTWCVACGRRVGSRRAYSLSRDGASSLCVRCKAAPASTALALQTRVSREERKYLDLLRVCRGCEGVPSTGDVECDSLDCPVYYSRTKQAGVVRGERASAEPALEWIQANPRRARKEHAYTRRGRWDLEW